MAIQSIKVRYDDGRKSTNIELERPLKVVNLKLDADGNAYRHVATRTKKEA